MKVSKEEAIKAMETIKNYCKGREKCEGCIFATTFLGRDFFVCSLCDSENPPQDWSCALDKETTTLEVEPEEMSIEGGRMKYDCSKCESSFECKMTLACREENDNLETIFWHPYPQEKPPVGRDLLIQWDDECMSIGWCSSEILGFAEPFRKVIAWAELPKPYGEEE